MATTKTKTASKEAKPLSSKQFKTDLTSNLGVVRRVLNKGRKFGSSRTYYGIAVDGVGKKAKTVLLFTAKEIQDAEIRATSNMEDGTSLWEIVKS